MPVIINTPKSASATQSISLGGNTYEFIYSLNSRDNRLRFDILFDDVPIISGVKIMENQSLLKRYDLVDFSHGDLVCFRFKDDGKDVSLENLGVGLPYELIYFSNDELDEFGG